VTPPSRSAYTSRTRRRESTTPRREPVAWRSWRPEAPIARADEWQYREQGFLVLPDLFSREEIARLRAESERLGAARAALDRETVIREPGSEAVRSVFAVHRQSPLFAGVCAEPRLRAPAEWLLDDEVYVHQSRLNLKPGFDGRPFQWHSDFETWHCEDGMPEMRALSFSLLLDDNTACNGPLMVIPGSHLEFVPCVGETPDQHHRASLREQRYGVPDPETLARIARRRGIVPIVARAGSAILFDCNLLHASAGNITPFPRSNLFVVFNAVTNALTAPTAGTPPRPEFLATRGTDARSR